MATVRGFVKKIEAGRAGLISVTLIKQDGSEGVYVIRDIDGDPERFNERLSKLGLLRDAMNRAEPVFIEHTTTEQGEEIQSAARISRDDLGPPGTMTSVAGLVVDVMVLSQNKTAGDRESSDIATVTIISTELEPKTLILDLQAPERLVATQQLEMIRDAQARGRMARFVVQSGEAAEVIRAVAVDNSPAGFGRERLKEVDGFVESLSLIRAPFVPAGHVGTNFAHVRFTTAPPFTGPGNIIGLAPFTPLTIDLFVPKYSLSYELFEAGLRDNLRMRVSAVFLREPEGEGEGEAGETDIGGLHEFDPSHAIGHRLAYALAASRDYLETGRDETGMEKPGKPAERNIIGLAFAAELLAHLASASRPVWVTISRESLDHGPEGFACTDGVPTSDLKPQTLRDLRIPYPATWIGLGCFNPGVYRFQFQLPGKFSVLVDGEELCLHDSEVEGIKFAHACMGGEHEVTVRLEAWTCEDDFLMDIYQIR